MRNTVIHPVVLPVLAGLVWNASGLGLHAVVDEALVIARFGGGANLSGADRALPGPTRCSGHLRGALGLSLAKLLLLPALVLVTAHWGFGLTGVPLAVLVMMAALPVGSNPLIFAQRYDTLAAEATAAIVFSTLAFVATAAGWLGILAWLT